MTHQKALVLIRMPLVKQKYLIFWGVYEEK